MGVSDSLAGEGGGGGDTDTKSELVIKLSSNVANDLLISDISNTSNPAVNGTTTTTSLGEAEVNGSGGLCAASTSRMEREEAVIDEGENGGQPQKNGHSTLPFHENDTDKYLQKNESSPSLPTTKKSTTTVISLSSLPNADESTTTPPNSPPKSPPPLQISPPKSSSGVENSPPTSPTTQQPESLSPPISPPTSPSSDESLLGSMEFAPPPPLPQVDKPSALRLANRLYNLEGFKKQDVSRQLSKKNDFSHTVAESYFQLFDFSTLTLDLALRAFLAKCILVGETQERERVLMYFSQRYLQCNPHLLQSGTFRSQDSLHTLTCALVLLNTDLHNQHVQMKRMAPKEFIDNLTGLNEGLNFASDVLLNLYTSIRNQPLDWGEDNGGDMGQLEQPGDFAPPDVVGGGENAAFSANPLNSTNSGAALPIVNLSGHQAGGINPFLALPDANDGVEYKKGYIVRKCCYDANGRKTKLGKRGWRMFYVALRDLVLYCFKDEKSSEQPGAFSNPQVALRIHSALAHKAADYRKRKHVFRLILADRAEFLFRTANEDELDAWVTMINTVVARYSSAPLPAACSSSAKMQRPLYPSSLSQLSLREQLAAHQSQLHDVQDQLNDQTENLGANAQHHDADGATTTLNPELVQFLLSEKERYMVYILSLQNLLSTSTTRSAPSGGSGEEDESNIPSGSVLV
eukprot:TRINITY_DN34516_c0_g1_i1.p1 TRINITY_DN34516_c0_g1~~TRINITY_DN34516_c0_g1_i1.p1  ORF type:complete len:689 (+),score=203.23 TRINITY_DN34516_c0_g1_i1:43-2109(+)